MLHSSAEIAQLGERQTEDLEVPGSIPGFGILLYKKLILSGGKLQKKRQLFCTNLKNIDISINYFLCVKLFYYTEILILIILIWPISLLIILLVIILLWLLSRSISRIISRRRRRRSSPISSLRLLPRSIRRIISRRWRRRRSSISSSISRRRSRIWLKTNRKP